MVNLISLILSLLTMNSASADPTTRWLRENADIIRADRFQRGLQRPAADSGLDELDDPALIRVTTMHGHTRIPLDNLPLRTDREFSEKRVWASHWFPYYEKDLFESPAGPGRSTLEKYDRFRSDQKRINSKAAYIQKQRWSDSVARWEGLCDAWSIAAVLLPEPTSNAAYRLRDSRTVVSFSVGDQKALLLKSFEGVPSSTLEIYGQRFYGGPRKIVDGQSYGWIQPDLYADQFHRFLEIMVFQRKVPFVLDHDPSEAVWSEPVDSANFEILPIQGRFDQVFVRAYIYPAKQLNRETKDEVGKNEHVREYNYILGGTIDLNRNLNVEYGIWLNKDYLKNSRDYRDNLELQSLVRVDSRRSHPDFVYVVPPNLAKLRKPSNPEIDPDFVDMIVRPAAR